VLGLNLADAGLEAVAGRLGSDVPACLRGVPVIATGRGDRLTAAPALPDLHLVLVNPRLPSLTGPVYRAYDLDVRPEGDDHPAWPAALNDGQAVARFLAGCRNDLETPAVALQPAIGAVLALLSAQGECLLARMSGSGATCFALCENRAAAAALAARLLALHPDWWVTPTTLAGGRS